MDYESYFNQSTVAIKNGDFKFALHATNTVNRACFKMKWLACKDLNLKYNENV